eukprot:5326491-Pleurochrysis_carterae.AAC.1
MSRHETRIILWKQEQRGRSTKVSRASFNSKLVRPKQAMLCKPQNKQPLAFARANTAETYQKGSTAGSAHDKHCDSHAHTRDSSDSGITAAASYSRALACVLATGHSVHRIGSNMPSEHRSGAILSPNKGMG